jgi:hypothetical protein
MNKKKSSRFAKKMRFSSRANSPGQKEQLSGTTYTDSYRLAGRRQKIVKKGINRDMLSTINSELSLL